MPDFDPTKPVQTRDGRPARIICTDRGKNPYPIVALVGVGEAVVCYRADGLASHPSHQDDEEEPDDGNDLINVPDEIMMDIELCQNSQGRLWVRKSAGDNPAVLIASKRVPFKVGEFIEETTQ